MTTSERREATQMENFRNKIPGPIIKLCEEIKLLDFAIDDDLSREAILARETQPTTWKSFCSHGDRNNASKGLILSWIRKDGCPLDTQAMEMSDNNHMEITPDEVADFIARHPNGKGFYPPYKEMADLKKLFQQLAGIRYDLPFIKKYILNPIKNEPVEWFA